MSKAIAPPPALASISGAETFTGFTGLFRVQSGAQLPGLNPGGLAAALPAIANMTPANTDISKCFLVISVNSPELFIEENVLFITQLNFNTLGDAQILGEIRIVKHCCPVKLGVNRTAVIVKIIW